MAAPSMNAMAERYAAQNIGSIFLYSHEAHPGENYPHLTSMAQKFAHARELRDTLGVARPILVDALDGACHRAFGSLPNMTWILNRSGMVLYKAPWTDAKSVESGIAYFVDVAARRRAGKRLVPLQVERLDYREKDDAGFYEGLARSGQKAVDEFRVAFD